MGDMTLTKGNKAIANHAADGKDSLLFEMLGKGQVRFRGPFNCAGVSCGGWGTCSSQEFSMASTIFCSNPSGRAELG